MARLSFTILGCGSSGGVPRIGNFWGDCDPTNPKNRRRRCSMLVTRETEAGVTRVLVDTSPDMREQLLDAKVSGLDGVIYRAESTPTPAGLGRCPNAGGAFVAIWLCFRATGRLTLSFHP